MGTHGLNISGIEAEASKKGMNITEVMAIVEEDGWKYEGQYHDGESMVCSSFVAAVWKAAGLFGGKYINAVEWTPKDVYQVNFFNTTWERPQYCVDADPNVPWC